MGEYEGFNVNTLNLRKREEKLKTNTLNIKNNDESSTTTIIKTVNC